MYWSVLPVRVYNHQHFIGDGLGDTVDYALKIKRMDNALELDRMLSAKKVSEEQMTASVNFLADFRVRAIIVYPIYSLQHFQQLFNPIAELLPYFQSYLSVYQLATAIEVS